MPVISYDRLMNTGPGDHTKTKQSRGRSSNLEDFQQKAQVGRNENGIPRADNA